MKISDTDSRVISFLRTYMIILVIFCHMNPVTFSLDQADFSVLSAKGLTNIIEIGTSYVFAAIVTSVYFLFSGFLFGISFSNWDWTKYKQKLQSRVHGLLIPYLSWQLISISIFVLSLFCSVPLNEGGMHSITQYISSIDLHYFWDCNVWGLHKTNWLGGHLTESGPIDSPLWFVRDLMVATLFSPILYFLFQKLKFLGILLLLFCFISKIWPQIHGFSIESIFFFGVGLYLTMTNRGISDTADHYRIPMLVIAAISGLLCCYYGGKAGSLGQRFFPIFAISGVSCLICAASHLIQARNITITPWMENASFFVYAVHAMPICKWGSVMGFVYKNLQHLMTAWDIPTACIFLFCPFCVLLFCCLLYVILRSVMPRFCAIITGQRKRNLTQRQLS